MRARTIGFWIGLAGFAATLILPAPDGLPQAGWHVAGLVVWMAAWWMTEAIPLTATALLPFVVLPFAGAGTASIVASDYYSPILFLILGGAFVALAIERTGLHRRLALAILNAIGERGGSMGILVAFMVAAAILSNVISNTSTTLIMMPMALAVLAGGEKGACVRRRLSRRHPSENSAQAVEKQNTFHFVDTVPPCQLCQLYHPCRPGPYAIQRLQVEPCQSPAILPSTPRPRVESPSRR